MSHSPSKRVFDHIKFSDSVPTEYLVLFGKLLPLAKLFIELKA